MAVIYSLIGVIFLALYKTENGVPGNILLAIPSNAPSNILISLLMVVTCIGSFPLYLSPIEEVMEAKFGPVRVGRLFILNHQSVIFRVVLVCLISIMAFLFNDFKAVLNFNILLHYMNLIPLQYLVVLQQFLYVISFQHLFTCCFSERV